MLSHLYVYVRLAPGTGKSWTVSFAQNGGSAIASCPITGAALSCDATGTATSFAAGDRVTITVTPNSSPGPLSTTMSVGIGP
jgi:hypothetical protein